MGEDKAIIKTQAASLLALQHEKEQLQWKLQLEGEESTDMGRQIRELRANMEEEVGQARKQERVAVEKMEIYRQRYHQLMQHRQVGSAYDKKAGKMKEMQAIIEEHRRNLEATTNEEDSS